MKGSNKGGDGDDKVAGNKGKAGGSLSSNGYYGTGGSGGGTGGGNGTGNGIGTEVVTEQEAAVVLAADQVILLETEKPYLNLHQNTLVMKKAKLLLK